MHNTPLSDVALEIYVYFMFRLHQCRRFSMMIPWPSCFRYNWCSFKYNCRTWKFQYRQVKSWEESILLGKKVTEISFTLIFSCKSITVYFPFFLNPHSLSVSSVILPEVTTSTGINRTAIVGWQTVENQCGLCMCDFWLLINQSRFLVGQFPGEELFRNYHLRSTMFSFIT